MGVFCKVEFGYVDVEMEVGIFVFWVILTFWIFFWFLWFGDDAFSEFFDNRYLSILC